MKFTIKFTPNALEQLRDFRKSEQKRITEAIKTHLTGEPLTLTKRRKPLRENPMSRWELRIGKYHVFYDATAEDEIVEIKAIGYKEHNRLFIGGKEFEL
jgi:mRNA-degrading endonuclease RelE of RelBE toxin-antitoxin system